MQWLKVLLKIVKIHITNKKKNVLASLKFNTRKLCGLLMQTAAFYESDKRWTFSCLQLWKVTQVIVSQLRILNYVFIKTNIWLWPFHDNRQRIAAKWAILDSWHCDRVGMLFFFRVMHAWQLSCDSKQLQLWREHKSCYQMLPTKPVSLCQTFMTDMHPPARKSLRLGLLKKLPPTSQVGSIQILLTKGTQKFFKSDWKWRGCMCVCMHVCVHACVSHEGRCPWDSFDLNKGASETVLT